VTSKPEITVINAPDGIPVATALIPTSSPVDVVKLKTVSPIFPFAVKVDENEQEEVVALMVCADVPTDPDDVPTITRAVPEFTLRAEDTDLALAAAWAETKLAGAMMIAPAIEKTTMLLTVPVPQLNFIVDSLSD